MSSDSEQALENATVDLFRSLGYEAVNAYDETFGPDGTLGRQSRSDVVLRSRLRSALEKLNPDLPHDAVSHASEQITQDRALIRTVAANHEIYQMLKHGVRVSFRDEYGGEVEDVAQVIDWKDPHNNNLLVVQQLWGESALYTRRPDLIVFVNGLPLVLIELKVAHRNVKNAYDHNLRDYRDTLPELFWYNALIILSNGRYSRVGSMSATWEHFAEWKKINSEGEEGRISLETIIQGTCEPSRLLDMVENFTLFQQSPAGSIKIVGKNHQYLGVNNAICAVDEIEGNHGRLGVFWHTQGSGKSYSMVFFTQKILRKLRGNWTFLIVTDRDELDNQIYKTFADVGAVPPTTRGKGAVQADSGDDLKRLLREDHRYVFTLIQKFHTRDGQPYPILSERDDVIVITDEAHRSQYDTFAANMRVALPNAAFIGFTGTPLMAGEEKTREVFGDYVSIYNFKQSIEDGATVPLYYENRIPQLELANEDLNSDIDAVLDESMLDDAAEEKLEREFSREYHLITRDNRLDTIAADIVDHFTARGFAGRDYNSKAMIVSVDKLTAVRMYEKVRHYWQQRLNELESQLAASPDDIELLAQIAYMRETDMAVVVSQSQNEVDDFRRRGHDILPHRERMQHEDLATKFKDTDDPFRLVFVCAMWMTGFDAPACSTIYLDKPMRNHTLMQTIARANRVFKDKQNGLIVDYIGVFRNLERALAIYGTTADRPDGDDEMPVQPRTDQIAKLRQQMQALLSFLSENGISFDAIQQANGFDREQLKYTAVEALLANDDVTKRLFNQVKQINRLYKAILPHAEAAEFERSRRLLNVIAEAILSEVPDADVSQVDTKVEDLLDESIITAQYIIEASATDTSRRIDLSQIDFEELKARFESGRKHTATERLRSAINRRLRQMVQRNRTRMNYLEKFQQMIEDYNTGAVNVEVTFDHLLRFVDDLGTEEQRTIAENLTEEELAIFDLLTRPNLSLTDRERDQVKRIARNLLDTLKREKLVLDWQKRQNTREAVRHSIRILLDQLPESFTKEQYDQKCEIVYDHIQYAYFGDGNSIYDPAA
jgi:type I restriction enzyme, R subunit